MIVYMILNNINNKKYIGLTTGTLDFRWRRHKSLAVQGCQRPIYNALRKYGVENFTVSQIGKAETREQIGFLEQMYIRVFETTDKTFGYNITAGGEGVHGIPAWNKGKKLSPEYRAKLSEAHKGKSPSAETRLKMSLAGKGRKMDPEKFRWSDERKEAYSKSQTGNKVHSEKTKQKISAAHKKRAELGLKKKPISEETRAKLSAAGRKRIGPTGPRPWTDDQKIRFGEKMKGVPKSEEHKANMRASITPEVIKQRAETLKTKNFLKSVAWG